MQGFERMLQQKAELTAQIEAINATVRSVDSDSWQARDWSQVEKHLSALTWSLESLGKAALDHRRQELEANSNNLDENTLKELSAVLDTFEGMLERDRQNADALRDLARRKQHDPAAMLEVDRS